MIVRKKRQEKSTAAMAGDYIRQAADRRRRIVEDWAGAAVLQVCKLGSVVLAGARRCTDVHTPNAGALALVLATAAH